MSDHIHFTPPQASPAWLLEPRQVLIVMFGGRMLMFRPHGGPYFLTDARRLISPVFVPDAAVDFLLERGWLTRVNEDEGREGLYLLTAEGRRTAVAPGPSRAEGLGFHADSEHPRKSEQNRFE